MLLGDGDATGRIWGGGGGGGTEAAIRDEANLGALISTDSTIVGGILIIGIV